MRGVQATLKLQAPGPGCLSCKCEAWQGTSSPACAEGGCAAGDYKCNGFYTWDSLLAAINAFNTKNIQTQFLDDITVEKKAMSLVAFMANIYFETAAYTACKERLRLADGSCPADTLGITGGCSGGMLGGTYAQPRSYLCTAALVSMRAPFSVRVPS